MAFFWVRSALSRLFRTPSDRGRDICVRLALIRRSPCLLAPVRSLPGAESREANCERLRAIFRLGTVRPSAIHECLVDTGAYLTILPQEVWAPYRTEIHWLRHVEGQPLPAWLTQLRGMTGGDGIRCTPGMIEMELVGLDGNALPRRPVLALFAYDNGALKHSLLGLGGYVYVGRRLDIEYDDRRAWLCESGPLE